MTLAAIHPHPRIQLHRAHCAVCGHRATALVRWRYRNSPDGDWTGRCEQDIPWDDPEAQMVRVRGGR